MDHHQLEDNCRLDIDVMKSHDQLRSTIDLKNLFKIKKRVK